MDTIGWFLFLTAIFNHVNGDIKIIDLKVPSTLEIGSSEDVILDCDYEVDQSDEKGLEVKWFFGDGGDMVYQWIPGSGRKPQALGLFRDRIDIDHPMSNNPNTMYRALKIRNVSLDLTGFYHCKVSSFYNEAREKKYMTIYEPADDFDLDHDPDDNMVNCTASGIFPKPKMNIYILNTNGTDIDSDDDDYDDDNDDDDDNNDDLKINEEQDNDLNNNGVDDALEDPNASSEDEDFVEENDDKTFNVTSIFTYEDEELKHITVFVCEMWIPETSYKLKKRLVYHKDKPDSSSMPELSKVLLLIMVSWVFALMV